MNRSARLCILLSLVAIARFLQAPQAMQGTSITIPLESKLLPNSLPLFGMSNIFFKDTGTTGIHYPEAWHQVQVADIIGGARFKPVYAVQFKDTAGALQFVVDADSDGDLTDEKPLAFEKVGEMLFADVTVRLVEKIGTPAASPITYQIIRADTWVYARIRDYRAGMLEIGGLSYGVVLRPKSRSKPFFGLADAVLVIDGNRDGEMSEGEEVLMSQPFIVGGQKLDAVSIDPAGSSLVLRPSLAETAVSIGFKAPNVQGSDLDGRRHALADLKGKAVLLEFWSIHCPHADTIRPIVNGIAERFSSQNFAVLSIARESDPSAVRDYLKTNPKSSIVVLRSDETWKTFNPDEATPFCLLIDRDGVIRSRFLGANAVKTIENAVAGAISR